MKSLSTISIILVIIGGLNWLLVGVAHFDLVAAIFGNMSAMSRIVYTLVGLAAVYLLFVTPRLMRSIDSPPRAAVVS